MTTGSTQSGTSGPSGTSGMTDFTFCPLAENTLAPALLAVAEALKPKPLRKRRPVLFWSGIVLLLLMGVSLALGTWDDEDTVLRGERIAVVRVEGLISDTKPLLRWIAKIQRDDDVKGVLVRVDSPGGGAAASQELFDSIQRLAKSKPVVASLGSVAASGGLMVAMGAPYVVANPSTVTGSIGVRMDLPQIQGLMDKLGIGQETITTGRFKDAGSTMRPLTAEEKTYFRGILQDMHEQFVLLVAEGRGLPVENVHALADGRIMTGREAKEVGLVDELGGQNAALAKLRSQTGVKADKALLEQPKRTTLWRELAESLLGVDLTARHNAAVPAFLYRGF